MSEERSAVADSGQHAAYVPVSPPAQVHEHSVVSVTRTGDFAASTERINAAFSSRKMDSTNVRLICFALGIFVCYFYYGILQEKITRGSYVSDGKSEKFTYTFSLVFFQCIINSLFAKALLMTIMKEDNDDTKQTYYASSSFSYLSAMISSNWALRHVNYPTQVVGKSCKPIPVMVLGVLIGRKSYPLKKYFFILLIVIGVILFMFKDNQKSGGSSVGFGQILLLISLSMDGFTGAIQERMKTEHKTKPGHMMLMMNMWSTGYLVICLIVSAEIFAFPSFVMRHPYVLYNMAMFSVMSALGQLFIFLTVSEFGPLPCSIMTTTRKFFTVLGSVIIFGNSLVNRQWLGTAFVFVGLILDSIYGKGQVSKQK